MVDFSTRDDSPRFGLSIRKPWMTLGVFVAFSIVLAAAVWLGMPELSAMLGPETGSRAGRLPAPCEDAPAAQAVTTMRDTSTRIRIDVPAGTWRLAADYPRAPRGMTWRNAGRFELVRVELFERFPGRPRIDYQMHGIGELERCREPWGGDSAWIATGFAMNNPDYRAAIAILPQGDGRWLRATAYTEDEIDRQRELLAAVRTARVE